MKAIKYLLAFFLGLFIGSGYTIRQADQTIHHILDRYEEKKQEVEGLRESLAKAEDALRKVGQ
jgi:hypothetical protein